MSPPPDTDLFKMGMESAKNADPLTIKAAREAAKAAENEAKLARINDATEGRVASEPAINRSVSATDPAGRTLSMRQKFTVPEEEVAGVADPLAEIKDGLRKSGFAPSDPDQLQALAEKVAGGQKPTAPPSVGGGPVRPPIRIAPSSPMQEPAVAAPAPPIRLGGKLPVTPDLASRSGGEMSATPGLTINDAKALGIDPNVKITGLTPEAIKRLLAERALRSDTYRINAGLDAGFRRATEE